MLVNPNSTQFPIIYQAPDHFSAEWYGGDRWAFIFAHVGDQIHHIGAVFIHRGKYLASCISSSDEAWCGSPRMAQAWIEREYLKRCPLALAVG